MTSTLKSIPIILLAACDYGYPFTANLGVESDDAVDAGKPEVKEITTKPEAGEVVDAHAETTAETAAEAGVEASPLNILPEASTDAADASPNAPDGCAPILHKEGNGPASWSACYPLNTFTQASATDACNAYFSQFYQPGDWAPCVPAFCPNAALPSAEMVCAKMLGADGGAVNQICWLYAGTLTNVGGTISAGTSCSSLDPCGGTCGSDSQWQ